MKLRAQRQLTTSAILAVVATLAVAPAAGGVEPENIAATTAATQSDAIPTTVPLPHPVTIEDAVSLNETLGTATLGYRFEQAGIEGEVFPSKEYTVDQFVADFAEDFGTVPQIVGLVAESPRAASRARAEVSRVEQADPFTAPLPSTDGKLVARAQASGDNATPSTSPLARAATATKSAWAPGYTEVAGLVDGNQAIIATYNTWNGDRSPKMMPEGWGMEIDVAQYNNSIPGVARPTCENGYLNRFWAARTNSQNTGISSWAIFNATSELPHNLIGAYWDWNDASDPCTRQSMGIGIGFPKNLSSQGGQFTVQTVIRAPRGTLSSNPASGYHQAVYNDCATTFSTPSSWCMGLSTNKSFPLGSTNQSLLFMNQTKGVLPGCRAAAYPDPSQEGAPWLCALS
ncbi:hypothetical protein [Oerskovia sp. KBS0722]|uniref:hypothetical protein n=1 Tax=Oerskovia sp. KBS0722 TaxID=1179673 RepID=UPI00110D4252|nr:hypothetical protein [Oerskovia sp. KBS0722]QDW63289.1 hypothetical protein FFI11_012910 [Oerskovia sp. KBS0722]